jgi:hypothetical protein
LRAIELSPWSNCWGTVLRAGERRCEQKTCQHRHDPSRDIEHPDEICFPETPVVVGRRDDEARTEERDQGAQITLPDTARREARSRLRPNESWLAHAGSLSTRLPDARVPRGLPSRLLKPESTQTQARG